MAKQIVRPGLFLMAILVLAGCTKPHLDIFPPLSNEALATRILTPEQMHADIEAFYAGVVERHPELHSYADEGTLQAAVMQLKSQVDRPMGRTAFYRVVGQLSHYFNDGHSFLLWPYQEYAALATQGHKPFPFSIEINPQGIFLKHSYQSKDQTIFAGSQLISVNDQNTRELVAFAQRYVGGETLHLREQIVAARFSQMLWSVFGYTDEFTLVLRNDGQAQTINIDAGQDWQRLQKDKAKPDGEFYFEERFPGVGYMYLRHFDVDPDWFETFVDDSFAQARQLNIHSLIIDIRDNPGGNTDTVEYLTSYIADEPVRLVSEVKEKLNRQNRGLFNYKGAAGEILVEQWNDYIQPQADDVRFSGDVYLLTGPITYSAAIVLATSAKDNQLATLVGQTTGGFANQTAQGNLFNLPHSELRAYVPTRLLLRPSGNTAVGGVTPHHNSNPSQQDLIDGTDAGVNMIWNLVNIKHPMTTGTATDDHHNLRQQQ